MIEKLGRNFPCWCGSGLKYKNCHEAFDDRLARERSMGHIVPPHKIIKNQEQIAGIREAARVNVAVLDAVSREIKEGMPTSRIDEIVSDVTYSMDAVPAPLHYEGFPYCVCTSVNDCVCHGYPSKDVILKSGDIINVDCTSIYKGFYADSSRMFCIGEVAPEVRKLVDVTKECVDLGLAQVRPWGFLGDVGQAVNDHAKKNGYSVVRDIGGHGCGVDFHEDPFVSFVTRAGHEMMMAPGMVFTIEPMINMGTHRHYTAKNGWEVMTEDHKPSAQWEIQVLVTETGHEVISW